MFVFIIVCEDDVGNKAFPLGMDRWEEKETSGDLRHPAGKKRILHAKLIAAEVARRYVAECRLLPVNPSPEENDPGV
jgi:hypothetical protein